MTLPDFEFLSVAADGPVTIVTLDRADKRNALALPVIEEFITLFTILPKTDTRAVVLRGAGDHFSAGLDLVEHLKAKRSASDFMHVCMRWHEAFNKMEYSGLPIIAALRGATVGGGLELASSAHIRVADHSTYFALPEGQRGLFTGGGATIRVADLIGKSRMIDMMLTGRQYTGQEAIDIGLAQYLVDDSYDTALGLAHRAAENPQLSNFAICSGISHMQNMSGLDAAYAEAVLAGVVNTQEAANERLETFAAGKAKVKKTD